MKQEFFVNDHNYTGIIGQYAVNKGDIKTPKQSEEMGNKIYTALSCTYGKGYDPKMVDDLYSFLLMAVTQEKIKFNEAKASADWFNNNTPHVGQTVDYQSYPPLPAWVERAEQILKQAKIDERNGNAG